MEDLFDEIEDVDGEEGGEGGEGKEKKVRVVKPSIPVQLTETIRVVLASDRKNLKVQVKSDEPETAVEGQEDEDFGWKQRGYYGTRNWKGAIERACAISKEEKLSKDDKNKLELLSIATHELTAQIEKWSKEITKTLINNKINL